MSDVTQLEDSLDKAKEMKALGEAVQRLKKNRDFKKVFLDVYFQQEVQRLTMLLGAPNVKGELKDSVVESLQSIADTHEFLNTILAEAERAKDIIGEIEDAIQEADEQEV